MAATLSAPAPTAQPDITIDVTKDLESTAALRSLISADGKVIFTIVGDLAKYAGHPVSKAAKAGVCLPKIALTAGPCWKAGSVTLSLKTNATCTITVAEKGEAFKVATKVDAPNATTDVQLDALAGMTYINIGLDFDVTGGASGSGNIGALGISGKGSGSATTTLAFCQPVPSGTETVAALKMAFSNIVFPTSPDCMTAMVPGSSCRFNFDGKLNCKLDLTYGAALANYKLSASNAARVQSSISTAWTKLSPPSALVKANVTASAAYTHTDHFGLIVEKQNDKTVLLYLVRSASNEGDESLGATVGITTIKTSIAFDPATMKQTVEGLTNSTRLATSVSNAVSQPVNNLSTNASAKLNTWLSDTNSDAGLSVALQQKDTRIALFDFTVDLSQADLAQKSWNALISGDVASAMQIGGFTLDAGSGIAEQLSRSTTFQFHFFNLYKYSDKTNFFDNCDAELAADGTIQITFDVGVEELVTTNSAGDTVRFHFSATATDDTKGDVRNAEIDLNIEISEKGDPSGAAALAQLLAIVSPSLQPTIDAMSHYAASNPTGTLALIAVVKPSAYGDGRLTFSPYLNKKPQTDQSLDQANWNAIYSAAVKLYNAERPWVRPAAPRSPWTYSAWSTWNSYSNSGSTGSTPDRRRAGNFNSVPPEFWTNVQLPERADEFFRAIAEGMNLVEDLVMLAGDLNNVTTEGQWKAIQQDVVTIVKKDVNADFSKAIGAAILARVSVDANTHVSTVQAKDSSTFTTTLMIR